MSLRKEIARKYIGSLTSPVGSENDDKVVQCIMLYAVYIICLYVYVFFLCAFGIILAKKNSSSFSMQGYEPFVSYEGLEQLHRFIFVMAVTHISYSCLTMLLAIVKVRYSYSFEIRECC